MFIGALILTAGLTVSTLTGANIAIQRKGNHTDESCECGKSVTLSCTFKTSRYAIEWMDVNDIIPIAKCKQQTCILNPKYVEQYNISFDMTRRFIDLTIQKATMELNGKMLICSDGSNTASYNISVKDHEPNLIEDKKSGSIKATSGCISQDTQVSFKWILISTRSNIETEINPEIKAKNKTSCTNDSDCGSDLQVHYSEIILANVSDEGKYLKVTAIYGNESKETYNSKNSGMKYIIHEKDEEQVKTGSVYIWIVAMIVTAAILVHAILCIIVIAYRMNRKRSPGKKDIYSILYNPENGAKVNAENLTSNGNTSDEDLSNLPMQSTDCDLTDPLPMKKNTCLQYVLHLVYTRISKTYLQILDEKKSMFGSVRDNSKSDYTFYFN